jgi:tetratricopeptide (TPR) repeat protein
VIKVVGLALLIGVTTIASGIMLYSIFGGTEVFKKQTYWLSNYKYGSTLERIDLWDNTIKMSLDNPLTGVGQGNWRIKFPAYGLENLRSETGEIFFQRPHNDFLWVGSENGILGLVLYFSIFCFAYYYLFRIIKKSPHLEKKYLALAMVFGLTGYLVISFFSFPKERIEHQIFLSIILAISVAEYQIVNPETKTFSKGLIRIFFSILFILMVIGSSLTISRFISERHIARAYEYRENHNWQAEIEAYQLAMTSITKVDAFSTPLSWYIGEAWFNLNKVDSAHFYFKKAYEVNPYHLHVLNNLGTSYQLKGKSNLAETYYIKAHEIAPGFEDPLFNLCAIYFNNKEYEKAFRTIGKIDANTPNPKYKKFLNTILWYKIEEINKQLSDRLIRKSVTRIRNSNDWMIKVYNQSVENKTVFRKQLLIEVIYLLESVDSTINPIEAKRYREKFDLL